MSMDEFETACDIADGEVTTEREKPQYEIPDVGTYPAECIQAQIKERNGKGGAYLVVVTTWELQGKQAEYEFDGEKRQHRVFESFGLAYGPKAKLHRTFVALTGETPDTLVASEEFQKNGKTMIRETFPHECFVGMEADVAVTHSEASDGSRTFANIGSFMCKAPQKKKNADLCFEN